MSGSEKHTKGPYELRFGRLPNDDGFGIASKLRPEQGILCECWPCTIPSKEFREEMLANGRLFTAAPDLLAACKALREAALNLRGEVVVTGTMTAATLEPMFAADDLAQAAIAKAQEGT